MNLSFIRKNRGIYHALLAARSLSGRTWMRLQNRLGGIAPKRVFFSSFKGKGLFRQPAVHLRGAARAAPGRGNRLAAGGSRRRAGVRARGAARTALRALAMSCRRARWFVDNFNRPQLPAAVSGASSYVQTWHGDRGFKKMLLRHGSPALRLSGRRADRDWRVSGSDFGTKNYRSAFRYAGAGDADAACRATTRLVHPDEARDRGRSAARLGVPDGARVLLYAPTFRDATAGQAQQRGLRRGPRAFGRCEAATGTRHGSA